MGYSRQRAVSMGAASVSEVLTTSGFALLLQTLTSAQVQQLQRYLDATVIKLEADALHFKAVRYRGGRVVFDPKIQGQADRLMHDAIPIGKFDDRVRLNIARIVDDTALAPKTDNPDEAEYLENVRKVLDDRGVWLRLAPKMVQDAEEPGQWVSDPRHFDVWLSLGPGGDRIETRTGRIDRAALIGTEIFGVGFYDKVDHGPVLTTLQREAKRISSEIDSRRTRDGDLRRGRSGAAFGVVAVTDALGGASFPGDEVWQGPHKLLMRALDMRNAGNIYGFGTFLVVAAITTRDAAQSLSRYRESSISGAERTVKLLKAARTAGEVAQIGLAVTAVGAVIRGSSTVAGSAKAVVQGSSTVPGSAGMSVDALAKRQLDRYLARNPKIAREVSADLDKVRIVPTR